MFVPELEKQLGIEAYATRSLGIGGVIRRRVEDFVVEEVLVDGSKASINYPVKYSVLGSSSTKDRFLLCVLVKRNWDTISAVKAISDQIGINVERIHVAGLKDAKAVTAQHMTIEDAPIEEVHVKDIEVYPIGYFHSQLSSYYLLGNSFHITISLLGHSKATIKKRIIQTVEELKSVGGVPNFFGHQRFGTTRPITHLVGKAIVKGDFRKAAMLFLAKSSPHEHPDSRQARDELKETENFGQALQGFPRQLRYERLMLRHLAEKPDDYVGAFRRLPVKLQLLFPQAYQSFLFNKFLSKRIANGLRLDAIEVGDHVVNVERSGLPIVMMHKMVDAGNIGEAAQAVKKGKMRLALPLIGYKHHLSLGNQGKNERQVLDEEGVMSESFRISKIPEISLKGQLRAAVAPLNAFSLEEISQDSASSSKHEARISFMLYRGSYATVVLREIMKSRNLIEAGF